MLDSKVSIYDLGTGTIWRPVNGNGGYSGQKVTLRDGPAKSKNIIAARLTEEVGTSQVVSSARKLGVGSELAPVSLGIGTSEVTLLDTNPNRLNWKNYQFFVQ